MSESHSRTWDGASRPVSPKRLSGGDRRRWRLQPALVNLLLGVLLVPGATAQAYTGQVAGVVRDSFNAMTLPGAPITVVATNEVVYSELDGVFSLSLPAGVHHIRVSFSGYEEVVVPVEVVAGETTRVEVALTMERFAEEVVVTGEAVEPECAVTSLPSPSWRRPC